MAASEGAGIIIWLIIGFMFFLKAILKKSRQPTRPGQPREESEEVRRRRELQEAGRAQAMEKLAQQLGFPLPPGHGKPPEQAQPPRPPAAAQTRAQPAAVREVHPPTRRAPVAAEPATPALARAGRTATDRPRQVGTLRKRRAEAAVEHEQLDVDVRPLRTKPLADRESVSATAAAVSAGPQIRSDIARMLTGKQNLRRAIIIAEVLGTPRANAPMMGPPLSILPPT